MKVFMNIWYKYNIIPPCYKKGRIIVNTNTSYSALSFVPDDNSNPIMDIKLENIHIPENR